MTACARSQCWPYDTPQSNDAIQDKEIAAPNNWQGDGSNPVAFIRERWNDPDAFFLGFKGGNASISHAHMDAGSFIFEDQGIRWAIDLNPQKYLSKRDCIHAFERSIEVDIDFLVAYATSDNRQYGIFDLAETKSKLGYEPQDSSDRE